MHPHGTHFTRAIVRTPSASFAEGITTAGLGAPDLQRALAQHAAYCEALARLGLAVTTLPPDDAHPDSTFVEDTAVVTERGAILARPGAPSRLGEIAAMRSALEKHCGDLAAICAPGTLDGGDICQAGTHFFIGLSRRTNSEGARQLTLWLERAGYTASTVDIRDDITLLHLKSGIAWLGPEALVVAESLASLPDLAADHRLIAARAETYAANCVRIHDAVLMAAGYPALAERVAASGLRVVTLEMSEFRKMDGGLSCLSIRIP
ncbi:MAG: N(G),N(G)-dimethylarginine dimethylaminohydrolase [Planctomycetota bacterium]|nr:N(G),N(G)-dimethylarginine dimethylaminohydrolase [Planctomycetota bacterium]